MAKPDVEKFRVPVEQLRREHDPAAFEFECTDELAPLTEFVGQDRAFRALQLGLGIDKPGFNVFVTGLTGTGKSTAILEYISRKVEEDRVEGRAPVPDDWCYVFNFDDPDRPNAIRLKAGQGRNLREALDELFRGVKSNIASAFTSEEYERQKREVFERGQTEAQGLMTQASAVAEGAGFALRFSPTGAAIVPLKDGKPMTPEEFTALGESERKEIAEREQPITQMVDEIGERVRALEREVNQGLRELDRRIADLILKGSFDAIDQVYTDHPEVSRFLAQLREFTLEHSDQLRAQPQGVVPPGVPSPSPNEPFLTFKVNVVVDNTNAAGPPVIVESNPSWTNLFGRIERKALLGTYISDHTLLHAGSAHRANGGYLILSLAELFAKPGSWEGLKRLIKTKQARLEDPMEQFGMLTPQGLRPEPIPVDIKFVIMGDPMSYFTLSAYDEEFWEMFKVKADFDYQIERNNVNTLAYAGFICATCEREALRHFDRTAVARLIEHGSRLVDDQEKLSSRFGRIRDVVIEADYWAGRDGAKIVDASHVERAINERIFRLNLVEDRVREMITRGTLIVEVEGSVVGQMNGLAVLDFGEFSFGRPSRITARTYMGQRGVASIDRESQLSGKIHDKGVLSLTGYLGFKYAQDKPLSLSASISFEQGYDTIDGDSASLAELCTILSSLGDVPLRQDLAMTGSVNQKGEVQPIGGVNQKVEGFHDVCKAIGFTGTQGVIIPSRNLRNLMLRRDLVESVREGQFRVYSVSTVDEALELLTGLPAGARGKTGHFPKDSVHGKVEARLRQMGQAMRQFGRGPTNGAAPEKSAQKPEPAKGPKAPKDPKPPEPPEPTRRRKKA